MNALSLFSGIGGIDLACEWAGIKTVAMCEREPFCQKVLHKHWPDVPIYDDVKTLTKERLEADGIGTIDLIHGGYPCQPFSLAGKREGENDDRHLWPEVLRLVKSIRPNWFVGENVAGHVTMGLDSVLSDLGDIGYTCQSFVIPAAAVYAQHRRDRVFIVAYTKSLNTGGLPIGAQEALTRFTFDGEDVPNTSSEGLPIRRRPKRAESYEKERTGMEPKFERCGEDVADSKNGWNVRGNRSVRAHEGTGINGSDNGKGTKRNDGREWWAVEPDVGRVANGVSQRVDRLKALGNAVVPQQIYPILAAIKQIDEMLRTA